MTNNESRRGPKLRDDMVIFSCGFGMVKVGDEWWLVDLRNGVNYVGPIDEISEEREKE